jgi:hypothetical protein
MRQLVILLLFLCSALRADWRPIGGVQAEHFDSGHKAWMALPLRVQYQKQPEGVRVQLPPLKAGQPLTARLDFKRLPHYGTWIAERQAQGGASWAALKALLDELGEGPAMALIQEPLPAGGPVKVLLGLRRNSRFELYATVPGELQRCGTSLCFEPQEPQFASQSAALAWKLLKPLARAQAKASLKR